MSNKYFFPKKWRSNLEQNVDTLHDIDSKLKYIEYKIESNDAQIESSKIFSIGASAVLGILQFINKMFIEFNTQNFLFAFILEFIILAVLVFLRRIFEFEFKSYLIDKKFEINSIIDDNKN